MTRARGNVLWIIFSGMVVGILAGLATMQDPPLARPFLVGAAAYSLVILLGILVDDAQ